MLFDRIQFLWKSSSSGNGDCPSIMQVDGGYVLVGKVLDGEALAQVHAIGQANNSGIGADETAVFLPADVIDRIRETA
ncbi:lipid A biosynthesis lauroyl acyltransferase [Actinoplanes sp. NPDC026619]|uniref:lipid A biosynthesis lauroyl acyltransferase n=1 Tax=Actinoplanes sp. NPDC026619 TaxID=3155798 RepID=UPI0034090D3C